MSQTLSAVIFWDDGWFVAEYPETGTVGQGKTVDEALANLKEATELYLEDFPIKTTRRPLLTTFEANIT